MDEGKREHNQIKINLFKFKKMWDVLAWNFKVINFSFHFLTSAYDYMHIRDANYLWIH